MKKRILPLLIALALTVGAIIGITVMTSAEETAVKTLPAAEQQGEVIEVWLVAGQSNAIGSAKLNTYPTDEAYADFKTLLTNGSDNVWHLRNTYTDFVAAGFSQGSGTQCGPELGITTALDNSVNKNAIIKVAYGNTSLYNNTTSKESINYGTWTPPSYIESHNINTVGNRTGDLYLTFIAKVAEGLEQLIAAGYTPVLKGVWYMQGEADTFGAASSAAYEELLTMLISDMRSDLTDVSGYDCSELPFVYGRILRKDAINPETNKPYIDSTPYVPAVQAAQDNVANNSALKNVFMINTTTDLVDPVTGEHRLPYQQDGWHYDTISQQMIGERFVSIVNSVEGTFTRYGYIPENYSDSEKYPFAVFKSIDGKYVFDSAAEYKSSSDTCWATTMTRAITLTKSDGTAVTDDVVVLLRRDLDTTSFLQHTSDIGATVTVDLNGYSFTSRKSLCNTKTDDCLASGATVAKNGVINVKNGTLLMGDFGILYAAKNGTYTKEKTLTFNFEDLNIGFANNAKADCKTLLGIAQDSHAGNVVAKYEMNFVNCVIDAVTNCPTVSSFRLADLDASGESEANGYNNAVSLTFKECTIKVKDVKHLEIPMSAEGDSVKFLKGEDGSYCKLVLPSSTSQSFVGVDGDYEVQLTAKAKNGVYYLVESADVETPYGTIPAQYSNSSAYPYALFIKQNGEYVFDSVQSNVKTSFERAVVLAHAKTGVTDDVVILTRHSIGQDGSYPYNIADIAGTLTLDLNGNTIKPTTTLFRTDYDDDGVVNGKQVETNVIVKNGTMEFCQFGVVFATVGSNYTVPKTINLNIENVTLRFYEATKTYTPENYKYRDLLVSDRGDSTTTDAYMNLKAINCTFDLETNALGNAVLGTLESSKDHDNNNFSVEIIGGTIITDNIAKVNCGMKGTGDSLTFKRNADGKYPVILMKQNLTEPASSICRNGEDGKSLSFIETLDRVGVYKVYEMCEDVMTKYGRIPYSAAVNNFAVFVRNGNDGYTYYGAYSGWKLAFEAARDLTNGSATAYSEAMIYMLRDSTETSVPYHQNACGIINLDLNGKKLIVKGSFFNTYLTSSNSSTSTVNVFNGTISTWKYGLIYTAVKDTTYEEAGIEKTITLNFDNVNLGFEEYTAGTHASLTAYAYNGTTALNMTINMNFENCKFDLVNNASNTTMLARGKATATTAMSNANTVDCNVALKGCEFFVYLPSQVGMLMSEEGDSFVINKDSNGKYGTVITSTSNEEVYADIIAGNDGAGAVKLRTSYVGNENGHAKYELIETDGNITVDTAYGVIAQDYVKIENYPFVIFYKSTQNGEYVLDTPKTSYTYTTAMTRAIELTSASLSSPKYEVVILMRTDTVCTNFPKNLSNIATTVTVDLNGYELQALQSLGNTQTGDVKDPNGNIVKTNGTINFKNGSLLMHTHPGLYIQGTGTYTAGYQKTLNVNYENVYFGLAEEAKTISLLGRIVDKFTTEKTFFNLKYTNCTIDMATNYSTGKNFNIGNWAPSSGTDVVCVTVDFIGCDFIGLTEADFVHRVTSGQDIVRYSKTEDSHYATLTLPKSAEAPTGTYSIGTKTASFVKISETETTITYALCPTELVGIDYTPKMSLTLDRNLIMNVYIPVNGTVKFTLDGETYADMTKLEGNIVTLDDGKNYYRMEVELPAAEAARDIKLAVNIAVGTESATGSFTFSTVKYAAKVIVNANSTEVEKTLVKDVLAYVKAAYVYFGSTDSDAISKIDTVLGAYTSAPTVEGSYSSSFVGLKSVTLVLDETPAIRFYLTDGADASSYKFYIDGKRVDTQVSSDGSYVDIDVYAYALAETVSYTVNGAEGGSYHVRSYYEYVSGTGANSYNGTDKAELTALTTSFWKYLQSARAYKNQ